MRSLNVSLSTWSLLKPFNISRESYTESFVLTVEIKDGDIVGRGECEPHEADKIVMDRVVASIEGLRAEIEG